MAEFQEVMKQRNRMCHQHESCWDCPLQKFRTENTNNEFCDTLLETNPADVEHIIMKWASEHPEPVYPTWAKWHCENFPDAIENICPDAFRSVGQRDEEYICSTKGCDWCLNHPIPADIAEKLGIKPIEGGKNNA